MTFRPGQSGNPNGRPKGIVDKRAVLRELLEPHAADIITKVISLAKTGDTVALRLCIERLLPRVKQDDSISFDLPEGRLDSGDSMISIVNGITDAVATGQMTIDEAEKFTEFLKKQRWQLEQAERKKREEIDSEERRLYWEARRKEEAASEGS